MLLFKGDPPPEWVRFGRWECEFQVILMECNRTAGEEPFAEFRTLKVPCSVGKFAHTEKCGQGQAKRSVERSTFSGAAIEMRQHLQQQIPCDGTSLQ